MAYPWPGFSSFLFTREEIPIFGTDMGWQRLPSIDRTFLTVRPETCLLYELSQRSR